MRQLKIVTQITNRDSESLVKYFNEINNIPMISQEEEVVLAQQIRNGDKVALEKLTRANLRFVVSVAKQYQNQGMGLSDLISEGNLGLIKAAQRFDETKGFKFISYAVWWIRQQILESLAEQSRIVRLPQNKIGTYNKINRAYVTLAQEYEREPSPEEIAESLDMSVNEVDVIMTGYSRHVSLDVPTPENENIMFSDMLSGSDEADNEVLHASMKVELQRSLDSLNKREADILSAYFGIGKSSVDDLCKKFRLTRERMRQIKDRAIRKLQMPKHTKRLRVYLT